MNRSAVLQLQAAVLSCSIHLYGVSMQSLGSCAPILAVSFFSLLGKAGLENVCLSAVAFVLYTVFACLCSALLWALSGSLRDTFDADALKVVCGTSQTWLCCC